MKKHIKIISLLTLFGIASTTFFIFAKRPADDRPETIDVKGYYNEIDTYYGNDKIEELDCKPKELNKKLIDVIQKLNKQGYRVISQSQSSPGNGNAAAETWVLTLK